MNKPNIIMVEEDTGYLAIILDTEGRTRAEWRTYLQEEVDKREAA